MVKTVPFEWEGITVRPLFTRSLGDVVVSQTPGWALLQAAGCATDGQKAVTLHGIRPANPLEETEAGDVWGCV